MLINNLAIWSHWIITHLNKATRWWSGRPENLVWGWTWTSHLEGLNLSYDWGRGVGGQVVSVLQWSEFESHLSLCLLGKKSLKNENKWKRGQELHCHNALKSCFLHLMIFQWNPTHPSPLSAFHWNSFRNLLMAKQSKYDVCSVSRMAEFDLSILTFSIDLKSETALAFQNALWNLTWQITWIMFDAAGVLHVPLLRVQLTLDLPLPVLRVHVQHLRLKSVTNIVPIVLGWNSAYIDPVDSKVSLTLRPIQTSHS